MTPGIDAWTVALRGAVTIEIGPGCTACGACVATCGPKALSVAPKRPDVDQAACTACGACIEVCPANAVTEVRS